MAKGRKPEKEGIPYVPARSEEQLLIQSLADLRAERILCTSWGRGQLAGFLASLNPESQVTCHYLDSHYFELAKEYWSESDVPPELVCSEDLPEGEVDAVCVPVQRQGDAELTRDLLQQAHQRLKIGGVFLTAVDAPKDHWLHEQLKGMFDKVTRTPMKRGVFYSCHKSKPLKRVRNFSAEFTMRIGEETLTLTSRPGVFSHRRLDDGAWALIKAISLNPGMRVLDLGCGCGAVGIAAMKLGDAVKVTAIDSHARAVASTLRNAEAILTEEELARFRVLQTHKAKVSGHSKFDLVLTNPPYFSNFTIAKLFVDSAKNLLVPSGKLVVVTKSPGWYEEHLATMFRKVNTENSGAYQIVTASNRR